MENVLGPFVVIIPIFLFIAAVMSIFIPFWVFRIRNEAIEQKILLKKILAELEKESNRTSVHRTVQTTDTSRGEKELQEKCWNCLKMTDISRPQCSHCGATVNPGGKS